MFLITRCLLFVIVNLTVHISVGIIKMYTVYLFLP